MTDAPIEWLERLYASNAPEADWAQELLDRVEDNLDAINAFDEGVEVGRAERATEVAELEQDAADREAERDDILEALGASDIGEAVAMARAMREAFES